MALRRLGVPKSQVAALGDRIETDILGARSAGLKSIMVLTGISTRKELRRAKIRPTLVVQDLPALQAAWLRSGVRRNG
jgi:4-nitrophenyl phosphatase